MKKLTWFDIAFIASIAALPASARSIEIEREMGCQLIFTQAKRLEASAIVLQSVILKSKGLETPSSVAAGEQASQDVSEWTKTGKCHPITGKFKVLETRRLGMV